MDQKLKALQEKLATAQAKMDKILDQAKAGGNGLDFTKVTEVSGTDVEKAAAFRAINDDCGATMKEINEHRETLKAAEAADARRELVKGFSHPENKGEKKDSKTEAKVVNLAQEFIAKAQHAAGQGRTLSLKEFYSKEREIEGVSLKTLMETAAGWEPESIRSGRVVPKAVRPIEVIDLIPSGQTNMVSIKYMEETTLDESNVAEKAEAAQFGEAAIVLTEKESPVRKIPVFLPVTDEQLEDVPQAQGLINNRLPAMLRRRLDYQLVNGDGAAPNLRGLLNLVGSQSYARSTVAGDQPVDALRRAMTLIQTVAFRNANAIILNPLDWEGIRLMKTNDGLYIWGHPSESGLAQVWGLPVAPCNSIAEETAIVADLTETELAEKRGITLKVSDSHSDFFIKGKQAIRADMRVAFVVYRPASIVEVNLA